MDRTDQSIRDDVTDALVESGIEVADLGIEVSGRQVSLTGGVRSQAEKTAVGDRVAPVPGVLSVDNRLEVVEPDRLSHEAYLARRIQTHLAEAPELTGEQIEVTTTAQAIVISGAVSTSDKKGRAERIAYRMAGTLPIRNEITVASPADPADEHVARSVEDALNDNEFVESENVQVRVDSGRVVLSGTVSTWEAKKAAYDTAVYASGAGNVDDQLEIAELK